MMFFLISPKACWADVNSQAKNYRDYINSPVNAADGSESTNINPPAMTSPSPKKDADSSDTKSPLPGIPDQWKTCAMDSDCTAAVADCVSWDALNRKYLNNLSQNLRSCTKSIDPGFQPEALCIKKACQTTDINTFVSWEEWYSDMQKRKTWSSEVEH